MILIISLCVIVHLIRFLDLYTKHICNEHNRIKGFL